MEWDGNAQLRITAWPPRPLPLPAAIRIHSELDPTRSVIVPPFEKGMPVGGKELLHLSGQTYLRLEQVDLDDPDSILEFVNRYGCLGGWSAYYDLFQAATSRASDTIFFGIFDGQLDGDAVWKTREEALYRQMAELPAWLPEDQHDGWRKRTSAEVLKHLPQVVETLDEFRFAARLLLDLKTAWQVLREGADPTTARWLSDPVNQQPIALYNEVREAIGEAPAKPVLGSLVRPSTFLSDYLPRLLHWFQPKLDMRMDFDPPAPPEAMFAPPTEVIVEPKREADRVPLYAICALELYNHILENARYHTCANERCEKTFVHQEGRSEKGQHRSRGVKFCTPACARATAQRNYRRSKRRNAATRS